MVDQLPEEYQQAFPWDPSDFPDTEQAVPDDPAQATNVYGKRPRLKQNLRGVQDTFTNNCHLKDRMELQGVEDYLRLNGGYHLVMVSTRLVRCSQGSRPVCCLKSVVTRPFCKV